MVKRADAEWLGGFDPNQRRVEDVDFAVRAGLAGACAVGTEKALFTQFATVGVDKSALANYLAELQVVDKCREFLKRRGQYATARRWFGVRYYYFSGQWLRFLVALTAAFSANPVAVGRRLVGTLPRRLVHDLKRHRGHRA